MASSFNTQGAGGNNVADVRGFLGAFKTKEPKMQGQEYFGNQAKSSDPKIKSAALNWLARNPVSSTKQNTNFGASYSQGGTQTNPVHYPSTPTTQGIIKPTIANSQSATIDPMSAARGLYKAGEQTDWEKAAAQNVQNAAGVQNFGQFAPNAEAGFYSGLNLQNPDDRAKMQGLITRPDLVGRAAPEQDLYNKFANSYGTQSNIGLQAAQTAAGRGLTAAQGVLSASAPQITSPGQVPFNPLTGDSGQIIGSQGGGNGLLVSGNLQQLPKLQSAYTQMQTNLGSIQGIENLLSGALGGQNASDINAINQAVNTLKANTSSPQYNQFRTLLGSLGQLYSGYLSGSGQETDTTRQLAQSLIDGTANANTIKSVLDTLRSEGQVRLNALHSQIQNISSNPSYLGSPSGGQGGSTGGFSGFTNGGAF